MGSILLGFTVVKCDFVVLVVLVVRVVLVVG